MAERRLSVGVFVFVFIVAFHGVKLAEGGNTGSLSDWKEIRDWYVDMAENGRKDGESCNWADNFGALLYMVDVAGKQAQELTDENAKNLVGSLVYEQTRKNLKPSLKKKVCAAKKNLVCTFSDNCQNCNTSKTLGEAAKGYCEKYVWKIMQAGSLKVNAVIGLLAATLLFLAAV